MKICGSMNPIMSHEIQLLTSLDTFQKLHHAAESCRKIGVPVDRDTLTQLLTDHSALVAACQRAGIRVLEPKRERATLLRPR